MLLIDSGHVQNLEVMRVCGQQFILVDQMWCCDAVWIRGRARKMLYGREEIE